MNGALSRGLAWLTDEKHSLYGAAVTRAILGFVVASQLLVNWADRQYTWGDGSSWTEPLQDARSWPWFLHGIDHLGGWGFDLAYVATIVAGVAMTIGWHARLATIATLLLWVSLYVSNPFVGSGGDAVLRMALLYLCFIDTGRHLSWDARKRGTKVPRVTGPVWFSTTLHNAALILVVHQVVMVYVASAFWKLQGDRWTDGTAVYYPLQTQAYSPWGDLIEPLSSWSPLIHAASWSALVVQLFFPVLLLYRPSRFVGLLVITGMHLGIGLFMGIMYFSLAMIAVDMILVSDASWRVGLEWLRGRLARDRRERTEHDAENRVT